MFRNAAWFELDSWVERGQGQGHGLLFHNAARLGFWGRVQDHCRGPVHGLCWGCRMAVVGLVVGLHVDGEEREERSATEGREARESSR